MSDIIAFEDELVAAALVGTARAQLPVFAVDAPALAALLARIVEGSSERRLLIAAGTTALWQQAGTQPGDPTAALPEPAPCEPQIACPAAEVYLAQLLDGDYPQLLPEWFSLAEQHNLCLSPAILPAVLKLFDKPLPLRALIKSRLGARGRWLAAQNPDWRDWLALPTPEQWETGAQAERRAYLRHLRAQDPAAARALLEATWRQESAADRASFAGVLREQLSPADEPFLEAALDDDSKQVRSAAVVLLQQLPTSALVARQYRRAAALLRVERGGPLKRTRLVVMLPEACDAALERDGVAPEPPKGIGPRAWWLRQILATVPPGVWSRDWQLEPEKIIQLADNSDYAADLLTGWTQAAARYPDSVWNMALLAWSMHHSWDFDDMTEVCQGIRQAQLEPWLAQQLQNAVRASTPVEPKDQTLEVLRAYPYPWSDTLTRLFIEVLRDFTRLDAKAAKDLAAWNTALPELALMAAPQLAHEAESAWGEVASYWKRNIERFLTTLHFRHEMHRAFEQRTS